MQNYDTSYACTSLAAYNGGISSVMEAQMAQMRQQNALNQLANLGGIGQCQNALPKSASSQNVAPNRKEKKSMFKEIQSDIKSFILEHRGVIYFIAFALMFDHFVFKGAFKARLQGMADKMVTKVEEKIK
ncbi:MAG TPA: hypothetical protein VHV32_19060 [Candidatus Angelobacter sp.]|nr:hypothetical protein [Candidatus Angelobacter sp.]